MSETSIAINFSGHPLCQETIAILTRKYGKVINASPINFDFSKNVEEQILDYINKIGIKIDGTVPITIIPPGQSTLAIILVAYIHGLTGNFPSICYLELSDDGRYLPKAELYINSNKIRSAGRKYRSNSF